MYISKEMLKIFMAYLYCSTISQKLITLIVYGININIIIYYYNNL